jgi:RNA polymerase sigma factor, sigma-70 family
MANNNFPYFNSKKEYESPIHEFRVAAGLTYKELMKQSNVDVASISALANGMMSPIKENGSGELRKSAKLLCQFFEVGPEILFPRYICTIDRSFKHEVLPYETWSERVADGNIERSEKDRIIKHTVQTGLNRLTEKERRILVSYYFNGETYRQIAVKEGFSVERVRQIVMKALRRIKVAVQNTVFEHELVLPEKQTKSKIRNDWK